MIIPYHQIGGKRCRCIRKRKPLSRKGPPLAIPRRVPMPHYTLGGSTLTIPGASPALTPLDADLNPDSGRLAHAVEAKELDGRLRLAVGLFPFSCYFTAVVLCSGILRPTMAMPAVSVSGRTVW